MDSIAAQSKAQLGGVERVFFLEHRRVTRWPLALAGRLRSAHQLEAGASFGQLVSTQYTGNIESEASDTAHGASYAQLVEGFYAGDAPEVTGQLAKMHGKRYLVVLRYYNGELVAIGDELAGLLFTSKYSSGKVPKERKGYQWKFEAATSTPAAYLSAPLVVEAVGTVTPGQSNTPSTPPTGPVNSGVVEIYNRRDVLVAVIPAGGKLRIKSGFRVAFTVISS